MRHSLEEALLARPDPGGRELLGREQQRGEPATASGGTASTSAMIRSNESSSVSVISDLPSRLIRFEVDSVESMIRPLMLSFARSSSASRRLPAAMSAICSAVISRQAARFSSRVPT